MTYPSNEVPSDGSSVAQDQIKAFVDRILRLKGEVREINADIREIYAEAKGNGFDKTQLGKLVAYVEKREADSSAVMESEAIFDLYLTAYDSASGKVGTVRATHTHAPEAAALSTAQNPSKSEPIGAKTAPAATTPITEPQPPQPAGSDLANPRALTGQVADIQPETANEKPETSEFGPADPQWSGSSARKDDEVGASGDVGAGKSVVASASAAPAPMYAAPGVITWESCPPEGVVRHEYSQAFGEAGQDIAAIEDELVNAASAPIIKIGNVILDGWARFMKARALGIEYPTEQYAGSDPLMDCIKLNLAGRVLTSEQSFKIAQALAKKEPKRKAEIYAAFELGMALA